MEVSLAGTNVFNNHIINRIDPVTGRGRIWGEGSYDQSLFPTVGSVNPVLTGLVLADRLAEHIASF